MLAFIVLTPLLLAFAAMSYFSPEAGFLTIVFVLPLDIYLEPPGGRAIFLSQLMIVISFATFVLNRIATRRALYRDRAYVLLLVLLLGAGFGIFGAVGRGEALKGFLKLTTFAMVFVLTRNLDLTETVLRRLLRVVGTVVVITSVYGIYQFFEGPVSWVQNLLNVHPVENPLGEVNRVYSTFGYALGFALFLAVTYSLLSAAVIERSRIVGRKLLLPALILGLLALAMTFSRAASVGLLVAVLVQMVRARTALRWKFGVLIGFVLVVLALGYFGPRESFAARATSVAELESETYVGRIYLWGIGLSISAQHPLVGVGLDNLQFHLPANPFGRNHDAFVNVENMVVNLAAEAGIPAALAVLILLLEALVGSWRLYATHASPIKRLFALGITGGLVVVLVNGLADPVLPSGQNGSLIFAVLAIQRNIAKSEVGPYTPRRNH
jgi:O-antigen ligase